MYKLIFFFTLLAVASANLAGWRNCGSPMATVHAIRVSGCTVTPCTFQRGTNVTIEVDATALANSVNLPFAMTAVALGIPIPIPLLDGNACADLFLGSCPAVAGTAFGWRIIYTISNALPAVPAVVHSLLWNDFGDVAICIEVDVFVN